jgi:PAS domain S-box-containing protein
MRDPEKTKEQLMDEVHELRQRVVELEMSRTNHKQAGGEPETYPEALYRSLFEMCPDAILVTDMKGTVTLSNPAIAKMSGLSPDDYLGKHFTKVPTLQAKEIPKYIKAFSYLARGKVAPPFETTIRHSDGTLRVMEIHPSMVRVGRKRLGSQVVVRDITERKQAEDKILRADQEWRTTFDSISDLISVNDKDFKVVRANKALSNFFMTKPKKLLGKPCYELFHGTDKPVPDCPHVKTMETKRPVTEEFFDNHLGIYVEVSTSPVFDEQGTLVASTHIVKDVTERKQLEKDVIDQGEFFRIVFNSSSDAIAIIGVDDFTIVEANEAFLHQYDGENDGLIGKTCYEVTHHQSFPCTAPDDTCPLKDTIRTGMSSVARHVHHAEHGNVIHVEIITSPIKDENGKITQVVHASRDVTERKHIEHDMGERIKELTCL